MIGGWALSRFRSGEKRTCRKRTLLYRQHGDNSIGAKKVASLRYIAGKALHPRTVHAQLDATYRQAKKFSGSMAISSALRKNSF